MKHELTILLAQTCSDITHEKNIESLGKLASKASEYHCDMLCLPEASGLMNQDRVSAANSLTIEANDPYLNACKEQAAHHKLWIHNGSTPVFDDKGSLFNRSFLIDAQGEIKARYDKIHLFDIFLADGKERLESKRYAAGNHAVVADTPWGPMGLSICYDLRFPNLYRDYAKEGVRLVFIPSAFSRKTGDAHWETLLRARAIENGCFVIASAQTGKHADGRHTYGHSLAVHPWGNVLLDLGVNVSSEIIKLNLQDANQTQQQIPSLANARPYELIRQG